MRADFKMRYNIKQLRSNIFRVVMDNRIIYYKVDWDRYKLIEFCEVVATNNNGDDFNDGKG